MAPPRLTLKSPQKEKCSSLTSSEEEIIDSPGPAESQTVEDLDVMQMAHKMVESTKNRREARRKDLRLEHSKSIKHLQTELNASFDLSKERISKARIVRLQNLTDLLKRKASIEGSIKACAERLEKAYVAIAKELLVTVKGRTRDLEGHEAVVSHERM